MIKVIAIEKGVELKINTFSFPDGEKQIEIEPYNRKYVSSVQIITRITNGDDLFLLMQLVDILKRNGTRFSIKILYLMGARMDRVMDFNRPFTLNIIADIINSFGAEQVQLVEPHSNEALQRINKSVICYTINNNIDIKKMPNAVLVFPDKGAYDRFLTVSSLNTEMDYVICTKERDEQTGKIISFGVENPEIVKKYKELHIIDDLCDAGGTFVATSKVLRSLNPEAKLFIHITHLVNPIGIKNLSENFDEVFITNSYKDWEDLPNNIHIEKLD